MRESSSDHDFPECPTPGDKVTYYYGPGHENFDPSNDSPLQPEGTYVYHGGNKYAPEGWMLEEDYVAVNLDWENGQVLPPLPLAGYLGWFYCLEPRSFYFEGVTYNVDGNGYVTGIAPVGGGGCNRG